MNIARKIKYIENYIPANELSLMTDVSARYLRYVKEGKRSGSGIKNKIDDIYLTFSGLEKRSYTKRRLTFKEKKRLTSLNKYKKILINKKRTSIKRNKVTDLEIFFNVRFNTDKEKNKVLRTLANVLESYKWEGVFQFYTFSVVNQSVVFTPIQVGDIENFREQFKENFIKKSEFEFYAGYKKESSLQVINNRDVILKSVKLRLMIYR